MMGWELAYLSGMSAASCATNAETSSTTMTKMVGNSTRTYVGTLVESISVISLCRSDSVCLYNAKQLGSARWMMVPALWRHAAMVVLMVQCCSVENHQDPLYEAEYGFF